MVSQGDSHFHYVCTFQEAYDLVEGLEHFWVSNCGCREGRGNQCTRSRLDVCLQFSESTSAEGSGKRRISNTEVTALLLEARTKHLVARPFHKEHDYSVTDGICFCCDDCCEYFLKSEEECDKGAFIETTEMAICTHCALCVEVCYFGARKMADEKLAVAREACYGCGLCLSVCPEDCIEMAPRS